MINTLKAAFVACLISLTPTAVKAEPINLLPLEYSIDVIQEVEPLVDFSNTPTELVVIEPVFFNPPLNTYDHNQIQCMAINLYHEARGEPRSGQIAVANVVMNRAKSGRFPSTPCEVVNQRNRRGCQFSWVCTGRKGIADRRLYNDLFELSTKIYYQRINDNTNSALFYHANYVSPRWSSKMQRTVTIGAHRFYKG